MPNLPSGKRRGLWRNPLSLFGLLIALLATAFGLPMMCVDMVAHKAHPYLAVLIYLTLPLIAIGGVALALIGMWIEAIRRKSQPEREVWTFPQLDLNKPKHQAVVVGSLFTILLLMALLSITGYRAYHFTESVKFCGLVCHQVMKPEYTAYQHSPHARVACTACHVGPGAEWFVRSKLSGLYQVYAVAAKKYPRPIPTPVKNLRPAQETCEQCHWPQKFFGAQQKTFMHYLADEANSPWQIQMLLKIGGGDPATGKSTGIHWHMNIAKKIEYVAADETRQTIPWVRVTDEKGQMRVYQSTESPLSEQELAKHAIRRMDCVDCHNRPSHIYQPPDDAVDSALEQGLMDASLPYVKRETMRLLAADYKTEAEGTNAVRSGLARYYQTDYPVVFRDRKESVERSAEAASRLFARTIFPEMRTDWRVHPNFLGHRNSDGCFRCHDGQHASADGRVITKDCNACHTILAQGPPSALAQTPLKEQPFQHPVDVGVDVTELKCSQCHNGTSGL